MTTRYDIRCQSAPWLGRTIHGTYAEAHRLASIISEECYDMNRMTTVDIMREKGPHLVCVGQTSYGG